MAQGEFHQNSAEDKKLSNYRLKGYWMPYQCARAVCGTFCHNISGALIPIFGPDFPSLCTPVDAPEYGRMVIDQAIVIRSTQEAEYYRRLYSNATGSSSAAATRSRNDDGNISPKRDRRVFRSPYDDNSRHHPRYRIRKTYATTPGSGNSPYTTDTDGDMSPITDRTALVRDPPFQPPRFPHSPMPSMIVPLRHNHIRNSSGGWTPANAPRPSAHPRQHAEYQAYGTSPWLNTTSRFTPTARPQASLTHSTTHPSGQAQPQSQSQSLFYSNPQIYYSSSSADVRQPSSSNAPLDSSQEVSHQPSQAKRPANHIEEPASPDIYHAEMALRQIHRIQPPPPPPHTNEEGHPDTQSTYEREDDGANGSSNVGADKKAALLLMNLNVRESSFRKSARRSRDVEGTSDASGQSEGVNDSRYNGNDGGYTSRYQAGAGSGAGVSSGTTSPFGRAFARTKRVRSNSM